MKKNKFSPLKDLPNENDLKQLVNNFEYKKIENNELPMPLSANGLVQKCNSFIVAASGGTECMLYSFVGIRPDIGNVIDENPFVLYYDQNDPTKNFGGIIHHGDWNGRTIPLEAWQTSALAASGITASFTYKTIPPHASGSLNNLRANGMLDGLSKQFGILHKNKPK
ncbi:MAG: hypothetical protein K0M50_05585 [Prolixibacteraceae bacterium]|nr:hypothetical protein [Prolixibacteraceae bacterium]